MEIFQTNMTAEKLPKILLKCKYQWLNLGQCHDKRHIFIKAKEGKIIIVYLTQKSR